MNKNELTGSDFASKYFTPEEKRHWLNLLFRLRSFEEAICKTIRRIETKIADGQSSKIISSSSSSPPKNFIFEEKFEALEEQLKNIEKFVKDGILDLGVENDLNKLKLNELEDKLRENENNCKEILLLQNKCMELEKDQILHAQRLNIIEEGLDNSDETDFELGVKIRALADKMESLEFKFEVLENGSRGSGFSWNRHGNSVEATENRPPETENFTNTPEENEKIAWDEDCEIMVGDPFLNGLGTPVGVYDGNSTVSFSRWSQRFIDALTLIITPLTEAQKINRLKVCLGGRARAELDSLAQQPATLQEAINFLQERFVNGHSRTLAHQALSIVKQTPGEKVFAFAQRLNDEIGRAHV